MNTKFQIGGRCYKSVSTIVGAITTFALSIHGAFADEFATHAELELIQGFPPPEELRVDRSNGLFGVPYNRWSYQNMRIIFPTANVPNAQQSVKLQRKINGGIDSLTMARENGEVVDIST